MPQNEQNLVEMESLQPKVENGEPDPYDLKALDKIWYPKLEKKLLNKQKVKVLSKATDYDETDHGQVMSIDDIDATGTISAKELEAELKSMHRYELENQLGISWNKVKEIIRRSSDDKGNVKYIIFLETLKQYRLNTEQASTLKSLVRAFAYVEEFSCTPFKWFMPLMTILETAVFIYHCVHLSTEHDQEITWSGPVPYCSIFIFDPYRRYEAWRYFTYMFVHIGLLHYIFNMIMQIIVGVFLEMEQEGWKGSFRVMAVYFSGVLAGSLGTSIADPNTYVAGASGGIYALIAAHLATMILNWKEDSAVKIIKVIHKPMVRIVRIIFISFLTIHDFGIAIYETVVLKQESRTGYVGHLCGAIAGVLVGFFILQNRREIPWEKAVQWIGLLLFIFLVLFAIGFSAAANSITSDPFFPAPKYTDDCIHRLYF